MKFKHMVSALLGVGLIVSALYAVAYQQADNLRSRADIIFIDSMKVFGDLERPGVPFPHDQHTDALEKQGKDCSTCHETRDEKLVLKFKRVSDTDKDTILDVYHTACITCHEENAAADEETGPLECGTCHPLEPDVVAARQAIDFDASLHQRHIAAENDTCENCHHGYDRDTKKIAYEKGQEESCRACHGEKRLDEALPYQEASHRQCITCHREKKDDKGIENKMVAGVKCAGCHDDEQLTQIAQLEEIPRLDRNQPDIAFVKSFDQLTGQMMDAVIFEHKKHEADVSSCSTCHHDTLNSCESCHSLSGKKEGDWVTLAQAMHDVNSERSCTGCHAEKLEVSDCAGCHSLLKTKLHVSEGKSCQSCHLVSIDHLKRDKSAGRELVASSYQTNPAGEVAVDYEALPEELMIDVIADEYQGVVFPHRAIVQSLMDRIDDNPLANRFHQGENRVCESCHHNSPDSLDPPPRCISCHAAADTKLDSNIPEMKAAYHQQCFDCHDNMEIKNPETNDCVSCHEENKQTAMRSN